MDRKYAIIAGLVLTACLFIGLVLVIMLRPSDRTTSLNDVQVKQLAYCSEEQVRPCVVSFSLDSNENMLVNLLLPNPAYPRFYLKIVHNGGEAVYSCQRLAGTIYNAYCIGMKLPPGELLHLFLVSIPDEIRLAEGELSIIGLAYPTMGIAEFTEVPVRSGSPAPPEPSVVPTFTKLLAPLSVNSPTPTTAAVGVTPTSTDLPPPFPTVPSATTQVPIIILPTFTDSVR